MVATGVPRDILVLYKLSQQDEQFSSIETRLDRIENILPEKVAEKVTERIMNEYSIAGTVPLTAAGVEKIVQSACTAMKDEIVSLLKQSGPCNTKAGNAHPNLSDQTGQQTKEYMYTSYNILLVQPSRQKKSTATSTASYSSRFQNSKSKRVWLLDAVEFW